MTTIHNLGFPRIGAKRELKFALEPYWKGESSRDELKAMGAQMRQRHWENQAGPLRSWLYIKQLAHP